jgi:P-type E1-E2 ATPase
LQLPWGAENGEQVEEQVKWRKVQVGDIIKVKDNELFPADLLCLYCNASNDVAYVKTTNLDGETNLKLRRYAADSA